MDKRTIGIVLPYLKSRGTEKQALRLTQGFVARGAKVMIFVLQGWGLEKMIHAFEASGACVVMVGPPVDEGRKKVRPLRIISLAKKVHASGCDILLSRAGMTNGITGYAGLLSRTPVVTVVSGGVNTHRFRPFPLSWLHTLWIVLLHGFPHRIVCVSLEGAQHLSETHPLLSKRITGIPNGVDLPEPHQLATPSVRLESNRFWFCAAGSLEIKRKGMDVLLQSMEQLVYRHEQKNIRLVLVGTGQDEQALREMILRKRLQDVVLLTGEHANPLEVMNQCQVFVLPSRREGLPNVLLEAMSLGLCAVAADCDTGPREVLTHEYDGLLVRVGDSEELTAALLRMIEDDHLRKTLGARARETVTQRFLVDRMVQEYAELLGVAADAVAGVPPQG